MEDLLRSLSANVSQKLKCPRWKSNVKLENYIQTLSDWFSTCQIRNEITKYNLVLEALNESDNELIKPFIDNFMATVRQQISHTDPNKSAQFLITAYLNEKFHRNTLTRSIDAWKKLTSIEHDPRNTDLFLTQFSTAFEEVKTFGLNLSEPQKTAFVLSKLNVDAHTFRNITACIDDVTDPASFSLIESSVRKNCSLPSNIAGVSDTHYSYRHDYDPRSQRGRSPFRREDRQSRDRQSRNSRSSRSSRNSRNSKSSRSKSRNRSRDSRGSFSYDNQSSFQERQKPEDTFVVNDNTTRLLQPEQINFSVDPDNSDVDFHRTFIIDTGAPSSLISFENAQKIVKDLKQNQKDYKLEPTEKLFKFGPKLI